MSVGSEAADVAQFQGVRARFASGGQSTAKLGRWIGAQLARDGVWLACLSCAALFQLALIVAHRPWLDEWQALLISRQTPTLASMFAQLHYEGHPPLWYLLLRGLGELLPAHWILPVASALLAGITWWPIVARAPFSRAERLQLLVGELLLFEVLSVSRGLTLGVALFFLLLAFWRSKWAWLLIALLPLCDFFFGVIACALIAVRLRHRQDGRTFVPGLALFVACASIAAWSVVPAPDVLTDPSRGWIAGAIEFGEQLGILLLPLQIDGYDVQAAGLSWLLVAPAFLYVCAKSIQRDPFLKLLLFSFIALLLVFGCCVYPTYLRHTALVAFLLIGFVWIQADGGIPPAAPFRVWLSLAAVCGVVTGTLNLLVPFDTAADAAAVIRRDSLQEKLWFSFPAYHGIALAGESGITFAALDQHCASQFIRWNFRTGIKSRAQLYAALRATERRYGSFYFLTDQHLMLEPTVGKPVALVRAGYDGQRYNMWKIGPGEVADSNLRACVPGLARWPAPM